jgi:hypothetical protein
MASPAGARAGPNVHCTFVLILPAEARACARQAGMPFLFQKSELEGQRSAHAQAFQKSKFNIFTY